MMQRERERFTVTVDSRVAHSAESSPITVIDYIIYLLWFIPRSPSYRPKGSLTICNAILRQAKGARFPNASWSPPLPDSPQPSCFTQLYGTLYRQSVFRTQHPISAYDVYFPLLNGRSGEYSRHRRFRPCELNPCLVFDALIDIPFRAYCSSLINSDFDGCFNHSLMCGALSLRHN